jgi:hypothetical protein
MHSACAADKNGIANQVVGGAVRIGCSWMNSTEPDVASTSKSMRNIDVNIGSFSFLSPGTSGAYDGHAGEL